MSRPRATLIVVAVVALLNLAPLLYMFGLSLHGAPAEGEPPVWGGPWLRLWAAAPLFARWLANSTALTLTTVAFHVFADALAGYTLAKRRFRGRTAVFVLIVGAMMIPKQVTLIPLFLGMARADLVDTFNGLLLPGLGDAIGIFLMRQYFVTLPDPLIEAARMDGANEGQVFWHVALPLARPALAVLAVLAFLHYWSDFFWPVVIAQDVDRMTVQVGLAYLSQQETGADLPMMAAGATAAALPVLIGFLLVRRWFFEGLRAGALRG